jgi:peptidylprolyl isomerase
MFTISNNYVIFSKKYIMSKVENGKSVTVHYTGRFEDGTVFDTSLTEGREPLRVVMGQGSLIKGFESGLLDMVEGEKKTIEILPEDAYGEYLDGLVTVVKKEQVPEGVNVGDVLQSQSERGTINVMVKEITEEGVKLDANHPMSGKKLIFDLEVVSVG